MSADREIYRPAAGETVRDFGARRNGTFMDARAGLVYLRPEGGGIEWTAKPEHIGPVAGEPPTE